MPVRNLASNSRLRVTTTKLSKNTRYKIVATNLTTGGQSAVFEQSRAGKIIKTLSLDSRGVVRVDIINQNNEVERSYLTVGSAEIDCCIAKLVHDAVNCTCKCDRCKEDLRRAQTVRLLIDSAKYEASAGLSDSATDKFNKAKSLCTEVCACGC